MPTVHTDTAREMISRHTRIESTSSASARALDAQRAVLAAISELLKHEHYLAEIETRIPDCVPLTSAVGQFGEVIEGLRALEGALGLARIRTTWLYHQARTGHDTTEGTDGNHDDS